MRYTIADAAERWNVDKESARGMVRFLVEVGLAEEMGERRPENGRGRAEKVYQFMLDYEGLLADRLLAADLAQ